MFSMITWHIRDFSLTSKSDSQQFQDIIRVIDHLSYSLCSHSLLAWIKITLSQFAISTRNSTKRSQCIDSAWSFNLRSISIWCSCWSSICCLVCFTNYWLYSTTSRSSCSKISSIDINYACTKGYFVQCCRGKSFQLYSLSGEIFIGWCKCIGQYRSFVISS